MTLRKEAERAAMDEIDKHRKAGTPIDVVDIADVAERVALAYLEEQLTTCPICSCVRCDALRRKHMERGK